MGAKHRNEAAQYELWVAAFVASQRLHPEEYMQLIEYLKKQKK